MTDHQVGTLNNNYYELPILEYCPNQHDDAEIADYCCEDCDYQCCSHCILKFHKTHKYYDIRDKVSKLISEVIYIIHRNTHFLLQNNEFMPELYAVLDKVDETWRRTRQTKKVRIKILIYKMNKYIYSTKS